MAEFQKDIGQPQFPFVNFAGVGVDKTEASRIKQSGELLINAYEGKVASDFKGPEFDIEGDNTSIFTAAVEKDGTVNKDKLYREALEDKDLNLGKIAAMRQQGVISPTRTQSLVAKAVQDASARLPAKAAEFRQKAAAFFGDYGPGTGLLKQTPGEKSQIRDQQLVREAAIKEGHFIIDANGQVQVPTEMLRSFRTQLTHQTARKIRADQRADEIGRGADAQERVLSVIVDDTNAELERHGAWFGAQITNTREIGRAHV